MLSIKDSWNLSDCGDKVIRNIEQQRCGDTQLPETLLGRHPEDFPPVVLPSEADLDTYVAIVADEEKIRGRTSSARVTNRLNPRSGNGAAHSHRGQKGLES
jgi:hypothetical protein